MEKVAPWNVKHIAEELQESFSACHTETERQCWRVLAGRDVARMLNGRKPTPGEQSILDRFGIHIPE